jgi:hypothetical protein
MTLLPDNQASLPPRILGDYSIVPDSGFFGAANYINSGAIPSAFSTNYASGYPQQTFLGASIISFNMNGGFGDSSSTLSVELVNDEYNQSDFNGIGLGVDTYHNGIRDNFNPPIVGSPVFFKFGNKRVTTEIAYKRLFDVLYGTSLYSYGTDTNQDGDQLVFGGILQSFTENRGMGGSSLYSVQVVDPREILSNVVLVLNNYTGSMYNQKNMFNIYGFLEHNLTDGEKASIGSTNELTKVVMADGSISYYGEDTIEPSKFPVTGTGFSRRGPQGIPYYRIKQAINALMEYTMPLPAPYKNKGFGGSINFRNYNYVIDFGTLPELPGLYYLDFDQMNMLELALEICDVTSRDLYVSLLPVTNHPAHSYIYGFNNSAAPDKKIAGIIRLDAIDRSKPPTFGAIASFLNSLEPNGLYVENKDVGYELSNIVTDRFIVGAQEVDMHYFSSNWDRGTNNTLPLGAEWKLQTSLEQQILPYYGKLGKYAVTIPKGFGAYQQILLDSTSLYANGVGAYYVATEMELRCCLISYERWVDFLRMYNDIYMESTELNDAAEEGTLGGVAAISEVGEPPPISNNYAVTVPRSVFPNYAIFDYGNDNLPYSPCNPPYGYPLYYKRMTKLGITEGGLASINSKLTSLHQMYAQLVNADSENIGTVLQDQLRSLMGSQDSEGGLTSFEKTYLEGIINATQNLATSGGNISEALTILGNSMQSYSRILSMLPTKAKEQTRNAMKVYNFLRSIAEECLGKKFLVKIPTKINDSYSTAIVGLPKHTQGPFGFKPRCIDQNFACSIPTPANNGMSFLSSEINNTQLQYNGALKVNYNPISEKFEYNYAPTNIGGFFPFNLCPNILSRQSARGLSSSSKPFGMFSHIIPVDLTHFINEQGRVSPYVRFDNSQFLTFESFNAEDFVQEVVTNIGVVPDIASELDNTAGDVFHSFDAYNDIKNQTSKQVAFVKCSVDENFYMSPKTITKRLPVHAQSYEQKSIKSIPSKIFIACSGLEDGVIVEGTGVYVDSMRFTHNIFKPGGPGQGVDIIDFVTEYSPDMPNTNLISGLEHNLNTSNVYALITLPNRVVPTKDARFRDGPMQEANGTMFKHYMTMDTVKGLEGFDKPSFSAGPDTNLVHNSNASANTRVQAWMAARKAVQNTVFFGLPGLVQFNMPSPVYPDLVALPLMSNERCYGPWISSKLDPQAVVNIGGKVEFIKDENLSPWNYCGYDLMNQAGVLQASFSNSLLLASERGGFTLPGLPPSGGPSLCTQLVAGGPLVTNIQISVSTGGIKTTYQMDLYTASFGKLQKQKQDEISKMSRERQKLRDERNALIRNGLGKGLTSRNYKDDYDKMNKGQPPDPGVFGNNAHTHFIASVSKTKDKNWSSVAGDHDKTSYEINGSMSNMGSVAATAQQFTDRTDLAREYMNTASASVQDMFSPAYLGYGHPNMPSRSPAAPANQSLFYG